MSRLPRFARTLVRCRRGTAAVEAAFVLPVLLLLLLGILEFGRMFWAQASLDFAVQETARCASVRPDLCGTAEAASAYAAARIAAVKIDRSAFTLTDEACGKRVRAQVQHRPILSSILPQAPTLTADFCRA